MAKADEIINCGGCGGQGRGINSTMGNEKGRGLKNATVKRLWISSLTEESISGRDSPN